MEEKNIITVSHLTKCYKLYNKPSDRLREALGLTRQKKYREHYALQDVSFSVREGECVGIIGVNGSGKSTVLKIITGVLSATEGEVSVDGRISALLELGAGFNMEYTGLENVYLNGTMIGFTESEIDERLDAILSFADIGDFIHQPVKTYSSGMFVRLAFAIAINIDPEILIVDEALSVGDVFFQAKCFHKFEEFKAQGRTILIVSHDLSSIAKYCDRVILLHKGKLLDQGSPKAMVDMYKQLLVHQDPVRQREDGGPEESSDGAAAEPVHLPGASDSWREGFTVNPNTLEYGDRQAQITDFVVLDQEGRQSNTIDKGSAFEIKVRIRLNTELEDPIVAFTFKNIQGTEITGTNTMYEKVKISPASPGREFIVTFRQRMDLQGGEYLLSFGCTGYSNGDFTVFHRLYDACNISVVSLQNTVGFYDMNSDVTVEEVTSERS